MKQGAAFLLAIGLIGIAFSDNTKGGIAVEGGLNISTFFGGQVDAIEEEYGNPVKPRYSADVGISAIHKFKKHMGFTYGLFLSGKGNKILLDNEQDIEFNATLPANITDTVVMVKKYTYLELPVLFRPHFVRGSDNEFDMHFFLGPTFSLLLAAKNVYYIQSASYGSSGKNEVENVNLKKSGNFVNDSGAVIHYNFDDYHRIYDINLTCGIGFGQNLNRVGFYIDYKFNLGLFDFNNLSENAKGELNVFYANNGGKTIHQKQSATIRNHTVNAGMIFFFGPHYY